MQNREHRAHRAEEIRTAGTIVARAIARRERELANECRLLDAGSFRLLGLGVARATEQTAQFVETWEGR